MSNDDTSYADGWRPVEGETLRGRVVSVDKGFSTWSNEHYPIVTIQPDDGADPVAVHAFHISLRGKLVDLKPATNESITIHYEGERPLKSDSRRSVHVYVVRMPERSAADTWATFDAPTPAAPAARTQSDIPTDDGDDIPF